MRERIGRGLLAAFIVGGLLCIPRACKAAEPEDTYLSAEIVTICENAQEKYNIAAPLLEALIETESSGKQYAKTDTSVGYCQLNVKYQYALALSEMGTSSVDLYDAETNIYTACAYINQLIEELDAEGEPLQVLRAYNRGPENAKNKYTNVFEYGDYANKVLNRADEITRAQEGKER